MFQQQIYSAFNKQSPGSACLTSEIYGCAGLENVVPSGKVNTETNIEAIF